MIPGRDWSDDLGALRAFAVAVVRDDAHVRDDSSAAALADKLLRQATFAMLARPSGAGWTAKTRAFANFVSLHRRQVRRRARDEEDCGFPPPRTVGRAATIAQTVRALPLELREALLIVVLAGFSHADAAQTLEISMPQLLERLRAARERLVEAVGRPGAAWRRASHLRVVK